VAAVAPAAVPAMVIALLAVAASPSWAQPEPELSSLSIEDLAEIEVTSVSKRAEPLSEAPAAIFVIGGEDIRRSGVGSLPEALRLAPNLQVQQIDARQYAIAARGFNGYETSNKLLALIDGRSIYTTLHAGIFWDLYEPVLEDLERIEVVSGPGGTLWGPNAVNGVINIISKSAVDTQGALIRATAGSRDRTAMIRYGGMLGESGAFRVYASGSDREGLPTASGRVRSDGGRGLTAGFRADWAGDTDAFMAQGEYFEQDLDAGGNNRGHHLLARWVHDFDSGSALQVQAYYDNVERDVIAGVFDALRNFDLSAQQNIALGRHLLVLGGGLRLTHDRFINQLNPFVLNPPSRNLWLGNFFVQDTVALAEALDLIAGLKVERTSFTGIELLPNARLAWRPAQDVLLWGAVSRSVRTPSRIDRDLEALDVSLPPFYEGDLLLGGTFDSEEVIAIEAGYRGRPAPGFSLSISVFYNIYDGLRTTRLNPDSPLGLPVTLANGLEGHSYGIEAWASHQVAPWWLLSAGVSTLHKDFKLKPGETDAEGGISLGNDPDFQVLLRSQADLGRDFQLDVSLRAVDSLPNPRGAGYVDADARLAWAPGDRFELFVAGANLFHDRRDESADGDRGQLVVRRIVAGTRVRF
jgi:iron complex outermembrane recepter protein